MKEGHGKLIMIDGSTYEGVWYNDKRHEKGRQYDASTGNIYVGAYEDGKRIGKGLMYYKA
jgi:hypothetical protein